MSCTEGLANPSTGLNDLPEAEREVKEVLSALPLQAKLLGMASGSELTRRRFLELCSGADIIHFAGHIKFIHESPLDSYIPLSLQSDLIHEIQREDRFTCAEMIENLQLQASLLFLNGCGSGRSQQRGQGEITGFLRAGFFCGASNIIYSLWPIPDVPETVAVVKKFYREFTISRLSCSESLRKSMLPFRNLHPWYWAGLQIAGK